jgi:hypothetical protein
MRPREELMSEALQLLDDISDLGSRIEAHEWGSGAEMVVEFDEDEWEQAPTCSPQIFDKPILVTEQEDDELLERLSRNTISEELAKFERDYFLSSKPGKIIPRTDYGALFSAREFLAAAKACLEKSLAKEGKDLDSAVFIFYREDETLHRVEAKEPLSDGELEELVERLHKKKQVLKADLERAKGEEVAVSKKQAVRKKPEYWAKRMERLMADLSGPAREALMDDMEECLVEYEDDRDDW